MKPSKDLYELRNKIRNILKQPMRSQISTADIAVGMMSSTSLSEKLDDIVSLIEQREREARIKEAKFIYENYFDGEEFHPNELVEHIEALQKGKL